MTAVVFAAALQAATNFPAITVEASRIGKSPQETASHVEVITKRDIDSSGAVSTVDLLEKRANIFLRKINANPAMAQVSMRGYGANGYGRVKITVDGELLNNPDMFSQNLLGVPLGSIERIEILHGPQTVMHGSDASAGVINIITSDGVGDGFSAVAETHAGSWNSFGARTGVKGRDGESGVSYYADWDWNRSDGWRQNGGFETWSLKGGVKRDFENGSRVLFRSFWANSVYGLPEGILCGKASYGADFGDWKENPRRSTGKTEADNRVWGVNTAVECVAGDSGSVDLTASFRQRVSDGYSRYEIRTADAGIKYSGQSDIRGAVNELVFGGDFKLDLVDAHALFNNDYERFSGAVFLRDEIRPKDDLWFFAGTRGECFHSRDRYVSPGVSGTESACDWAAGGEAGVGWRPCGGAKFFVRCISFYHAPFADEMFSSYSVANMSLKPEKGHSAEGGISWNLAEGLDFSFTAYCSRLEDEIAYYNGGNVNLEDETSRAGAETSLVWSERRTGSAGIVFSYVDARFAEGENRDNRIPLVPRETLRLFGEKYLTDFFAVNAGYRFVSEQRYGGDYAGKGGMMPSYGIFDIGARFKPESGFMRGFTVSLTVDNLFDRRYSDYAEYFDPWYVYPAAGRSFTVSVRREF